MLGPARHTNTSQHRRLAFANVLLILGILALGGFVLLSEGRLTPAGLVAGFNEAIGR